MRLYQTGAREYTHHRGARIERTRGGWLVTCHRFAYTVNSLTEAVFKIDSNGRTTP